MNSKEFFLKDTTQVLEDISLLISEYRVFNQDYVLTANKMMKGIFSFPKFGDVDYQNGINWNEQRFSRSYLLLLHSHRFLLDLINAYKEFGEPKYIDFALGIINDWKLRNPMAKPMNPMAWHDHGTAMRLIVWILFFDTARKVLAKNDLLNLMEDIQQHAELNYDDSFYKHKHNHGLFQDISLLVFSTYFSELDISNIYYITAKKRIKEYLDYAISKEGVHLEHSPAYHMVIAQEITKMKRFFERKKDEFCQYLSLLLDKMSLFGINVVKPDGLLPTIGDTFANTTPFDDIWVENSFYRYAITKGSQGAVPITRDIVFPESGYAIFRNEWEKGEEGTYIFFNAAHHSFSHKHADDLSVMIYSNGEIFIDSGSNGYDYNDPFTQYGYSSFSHNTLVVDNQGLPPYSGKDTGMETKIVDYRISSSVSYVSGVSTRYDGVKFNRELKYDKRNYIVTITDTVTADRFHNYKFFWHLAPNIQSIINDRLVDLFRNDEQISKLCIRTDNIKEITSVKGQKEPTVMGWCFMGIKEPFPTETLIIEIEGKDIKVETTVQLIRHS